MIVEEGPQSYSQEGLDKAFADRDQAWDRRHEIESKFRGTIAVIKQLLATPQGERLIGSRFRNQTDFYSLIGALALVHSLPTPDTVAQRLETFLEQVEDPESRQANARLASYYEAARSASNDKGPREARIECVRAVIMGEP